LLDKALGVGTMFEPRYEVSGGEESHPSALAEPDVSLSTHPAPIIQPCPASSGQWANRLDCRRATRSSQRRACL
jgi:hypothetical protein